MIHILRAADRRWSAIFADDIERAINNEGFTIPNDDGRMMTQYDIVSDAEFNEVADHAK